jgi:hypothetical protein
VYWEYRNWKHLQSVRIDFAWRGNYLNTPDTQRFSVKGSWILFRASCTLYLYAKPWHKRMSFPSGQKISACKKLLIT